jgi:pilus assembly protein CpaD
MTFLRHWHVFGIPIALALILGACATPPDKMADEGPVPTPHEPVVSFQKRILVVHFAPDSETPEPGQISALNVLFGTGELAQGDHVLIQRPPGELAQVRADLLSAGLVREGLSPSRAMDATVGASELRLVVEHAIASAPGCPDWTKSTIENFANTVHSNFGCATAANLAAMVADPRDLLNGRPMGPVVGDAATAPMHRYRTGKLPTLTSGPNITEGVGAASAAGSGGGPSQ